MAARSAAFGSGMVTWRSNRPGRSSAGSRTSGRLVAARTTMPDAGSKPSISASSWLSVCSRSSLDTTAPEPARRWPMASISSMKMMAGARLRAMSNRSRTRAAPTPTNISTKLEPVTEKNGTLRLARDRAGQQRLAGAGRPDHQHAARHHRAGPGVPVRVAQEVHHLGDLVLGALVAGHVGERGARPLLVEHLGPGPAHAEHALQAAGRALGQPAPQPAEDQQRQAEDQQPAEHLGAETRARRGRGYRSRRWPAARSAASASACGGMTTV